jgi:SulP family sulfate permease
MAAVLFMKRMSDITESKLMVDNTKEEKRNGLDLPPGTSFYEVNGPLFFGAAQRAMDSLHASENDAFKTLIIHMGKVPVIDATGFAALENAVEVLVRRKKVVILAGPLPHPRKVFDKARLDTRHPGHVYVVEDLDAAIRLAGEVEPPPSRRALRQEAAAAE